MGDALLEELYPSLWSYTAAACGNSCDPDDVLQYALLRTLRLHDIDELDHPAAYLRKVVLHLVIAEARRTKHNG
jgi:DNA-directed RNA polymerase specialized sigma24 family protein